ncbi:MAG: hypothetical protein ACXAD7_20905 [Candidatus Kariarchaeaceae archaeon]
MDPDVTLFFENNKIRRLPASIVNLNRDYTELDRNPIEINRNDEELDDWYLRDD